MIETFIYNNLVEYLKKDIIFNDLVRCVVDEESEDVVTRYAATDTFSKHFDDRIVNLATKTGFLFPFIGVDFGPYEANTKFKCGIDINVTFTIELSSCSPESCSFEDGGCSIAISQPRQHLEQIIATLVKLFDFDIIEDNGIIKHTDIFQELRGSEYEAFDCVLDDYEEENWPYNVWAVLRDEPVISDIQVNGNGIYQRSITIPLSVQRIANSAEGIDCTYCY